jgi:hypothetical protein
MSVVTSVDLLDQEESLLIAGRVLADVLAHRAAADPPVVLTGDDGPYVDLEELGLAAAAALRPFAALASGVMLFQLLDPAGQLVRYDLPSARTLTPPGDLDALARARRVEWIVNASYTVFGGKPKLRENWLGGALRRERVARVADLTDAALERFTMQVITTANAHHVALPELPA